jgi:hypothetical protein
VVGDGAMTGGMVFEALNDGGGWGADVLLVINDNGIPEPALIVMKSTQLKKSRKWNSMMMSMKLPGKNGLFTPPMYSQVYRLSTVKESNDKGQWYGWEVERVGSVEDDNVYLAAKAFAESIGAGDVNVRHTEDQQASASATVF